MPVLLERFHLKYIIKVFVSFCLMIQFCYGEQKLAYQTDGFQAMTLFMQTQPTLDETAKMLALNRMDADLLKAMRRIMKEHSLVGSTLVAAIEVKGNKISIEGLKKPIYLGNSKTIELSYDGEKIALSKPQDFEQIYKDLEIFFRQRKIDTVLNEKADILPISKFLLKKLIVGDQAMAVVDPLSIILWMLAIAAASALIGYTMNMFIPKKDESWKLKWPFNLDSLGKNLDIKCQDGRFSIINGKETINFLYEENAIANGRVATNGENLSLFPGYTISYSNSKDKAFGKFSYDLNTQEVVAPIGRFTDPFYTSDRKDTLIEVAKVVLGADGKRKLCQGDEFVGGNKDTFKELVTYYNKLRNDQDKLLSDHLRKMDSLQKGDRVK